MTIEEIKLKYGNNDRGYISCCTCPVHDSCELEFATGYADCWAEISERMPDSKNPYWERITAIAERQRAKGMSKYGFGLEANTADILERINHLQEELIDGLMYCEWIKEKLGAEHE